MPRTNTSQHDLHLQLLVSCPGPLQYDHKNTSHTKGVVMADYDIHIKGGTIVDGTGVPRARGDVWIKDGKIAQIGGRAKGVADRVIDADG